MKITTSSIFASIVGFTALLSAAGPSLALPIFEARVETCCLPSPVLQEDTSDSFASAGTSTDNFVIPLGIGSVGALASAGPGRLSAGTSSTVSVTNVSNFGETHVGDATARFILDDIVISGPESTVPLTLNLHLFGSGALDTSASSAENSFRGLATAESFVRLSGFFPSYHVTPKDPISAAH
jgi:hypothetical protein